MAEWLFEAGIGEARAALVSDGAIIAARIELAGAGPLVESVHAARLTEIIVKGREGLVTLADGTPAMLVHLPPGITQGAALTVEITREPIPEPGRPKLARCIPHDGGEIPAAVDLLARITATGHRVRTLLAHQGDDLEAAGWSEVLDEALTGEIAFPGGTLRMTPTPAMTLFDVDGTGPLEPLAVAAAHAVAAAIIRHEITGSIGVDFPTVEGKAARAAVAAAIDAGLPQPFERTAVNGFGFLQIVRRRERASLPELLRADRIGAAARALLRQIERAPPPAVRHHRVSSRVAASLAAHPEWRSELARRTGVTAEFEAE